MRLSFDMFKSDFIFSFTTENGLLTSFANVCLLKTQFLKELFIYKESTGQRVGSI